MLRRFGFKKAEPRESEARLKLQKELFTHTKCVDHGFPHKPSALAYDPKLKLLAIGTKNGDLRIVGSPGVEFAGQHKTDVSVTQLHFIPDQGRLLSLCGDNSLHLWEINTRDGLSILEENKEFTMEASKLKMISALCLSGDGQRVLLGTEGGNIHVLDLATFTLAQQVIYQDRVMQNVPDDFKVNPGAVEAICQHPTEPNKFLIGYNRGLIVLWDNNESNADQTYNASQQLESLSWHRDGTQFMSAHADGSYIVWSSTDSTKPKEQPNTPYGPFPCKAIHKVIWKAAKADNYVVFSGGMPRPSYADRHTVSVMQGAKQVVFDFTSRVVDFIVLSTADETDDLQVGEYDDPHALLVLVEEELVCIDLQGENWPAFRAPYLQSPHSSAVTTAQHAANVPEAFWTKLQSAGDQQSSTYTSRDWPITGGKTATPPSSTHDLLITGHEDGTVRFWDVSSVNMYLIYKLSTAAFFGLDFSADAANDGEEEWPPFRKVGTFDPYSDDPRLGIQKIALCPVSETVVIGGTAGQVVVLHFEREEREIEIRTSTVNVVSDREAFIWKGHDALQVVEGDLKLAGGFQPSCVMQLYPPAACTALAMQAEWQVVAAGTAHGLALYDYAQKREVSTKCTLNAQELSGTADSAMQRRKSFKKSLRESFRRLRTRRSQRRREADGAGEPDMKEEPKKRKRIRRNLPSSSDEQKGDSASAPAATSSHEAANIDPEMPADSMAVNTPSSTPVCTPSTPPEGSRTIERSIEARNVGGDDTMGSMVRCLYFADTFLINNQSHSPTMWAGTNSGVIYVFQITNPPSDTQKRETEAISCQLGKEIRLKHQAPVVSICIIDRSATPLPAPLDVAHQRARAPDMSGNHQVVICSEEQFKVFSLPSLKPHNKYKLTAHEGSKVRKVSYTTFRSRSDENYCETDLVILSNIGDIQVFSMPHLRRQLKAEAIRKENVNGIVSCVLSSTGEGFYPSCPSEFSRFSVSARQVSRPRCTVELKEGMRPVPVADTEVPAIVVQEPDNVTTPTQDPEIPVEENCVVAVDAAVDAGAAAHCEVAEEAAAADGANDSGISASPADLTADLTIDSVKVHLSDDREVVASSHSMTRTVVTRTIVTESSEEGTRTVTSQETHTTTSGDGSGAEPAIVSTLVSDLHPAGEEKSEVSDVTEALSELQISDDENRTVTPDPVCHIPVSEESAVAAAGPEHEELPVNGLHAEESSAAPDCAAAADDASPCMVNGGGDASASEVHEDTEFPLDVSKNHVIVNGDCAGSTEVPLSVLKVCGPQGDAADPEVPVNIAVE